MNIICFHAPDEEYGFLSNWYMSRFELDGVSYTSMEQYMMHQKAITFDDIDIAKQILETDDVSKVKALGRAVHNYNDAIWNGIRQIVVYKGLLAKFSQNKDLKEKLLSTGNNILAEAARTDSVWGIGISIKDNARFDMNKWRGKNLLGFALMQVRKELH
ncbi:MAG: NADAR family protein [Clostridia bacterium]|nr:NADAR family protein [Clostridia bacterium]